jgi:hypothetical protein
VWEGGRRGDGGGEVGKSAVSDGQADLRERQ